MRTDFQADVLYLDFDGVVCNSLEECFRSSWLAEAGIDVGPHPLPVLPFDQSYQTRFNACRPFIRSGEDYLVVHEWAARGEVPESQADFDRSLAAKGPAKMAELKQNLYSVRDALLVHHLDQWLSWNPLYDGMAEVLAVQAKNNAIVILSTKKAEFIAQILSFHGVDWPRERILYTGTRRKLDIIAEGAEGTNSVLIDDQIDHLDFDNPRCQCYLALWGYVAPDAVTRSRRSLSLPEALDRISSFAARRPGA